MKKRILKIVKYVMIVLLLCVGIAAVYVVTHITNDNLTVTNYEVDAGLSESVRIVQISDLHNAEFGEENEELAELVKKQQPDIILLSGDMINSFDEETGPAETMVRKLCEIAPVYFGYGNHEFKWEKNFNRSVRDIFTKAGAIVLDSEYVDVEIKGNPIRIGGYMGFYRVPWMFKYSEEEKQAQEVFFEEFENTERYKILINHIPTTWLDWKHGEWKVDLVFSGHYHGGQMVLPFVGPLYAPYVGFNPPYAKGIYHEEYATNILSSGVGNEYWYLPRINNPPEVVVVDVR